MNSGSEAGSVKINTKLTRILLLIDTRCTMTSPVPTINRSLKSGVPFASSHNVHPVGIFAIDPDHMPTSVQKFLPVNIRSIFTIGTGIEGKSGSGGVSISIKRCDEDN